MATVVLVRGKTLPDSGVKKDLHDLIDLTTATVSNIVNIDIDNNAAIAGTKISPNFGAQALICGTLTATTGTFTDAVDAQSTLDVTGLTTLANLTVDGVVTMLGAWVDLGTSAVIATQATTDGYVIGFVSVAATTNFGRVEGFTDSASNPTTKRGAATCGLFTGSVSQSSINDVGSFCMPVKKDDYYKTNFSQNSTAACQFYWVPLG